MPVVLRIDGFRFLFHGNEGSPREPVHIHVKSGRDEAKFWLFPMVTLSYNRGLSGPTLNRYKSWLKRIAAIWKERGMTSFSDPMAVSPEPMAVRFDDQSMWIDLEDGRMIGIPLAWFPRLFHAMPVQREACELSRCGLHWDEIDEDISVAGLLAGRSDQTNAVRQAAA